MAQIKLNAQNILIGVAVLIGGVLLYKHFSGGGAAGGGGGDDCGCMKGKGMGKHGRRGGGGMGRRRMMGGPIPPVGLENPPPGLFPPQGAPMMPPGPIAGLPINPAPVMGAGPMLSPPSPALNKQPMSMSAYGWYY